LLGFGGLMMAGFLAFGSSCVAADDDDEDDASDAGPMASSPYSSDTFEKPDVEPSPDTPAAEPEYKYKSVAADKFHTCAIRTDDTVVCWGAGSNPDEKENEHDYDQASPPDGTFVDLAIEERTTCGLRSNGNVQCWGQNEGTYEGNLESIYGARGPCGLKPNGRVKCFKASYSEDVPDETFKKIRGQCGILTSGQITCWESGLGFDDGTYVELDYGGGAPIAITEDGRGKLGGVIPDFGRPPSGTLEDLSLAYGHGCFIHSDHTVTCLSKHEQSDFSPDKKLPRSKPPEGKFKDIATGSYHTCAIRMDGTAECWGGIGSSDFGQSKPPGTE
jgi:hypothetical protein